MVWGGAILTLVAWVVFGLWGAIAGLIVGVMVLDFGIQSALVSNQHLIYALDQQARSRLNTIFMTGMFLGGSFGSAVATVAWSQGEWTGVSILGGTLAIIALLVLVLVTIVKALPSAITKDANHETIAYSYCRRLACGPVHRNVVAKMTTMMCWFANAPIPDWPGAEPDWCPKKTSFTCCA